MKLVRVLFAILAIFLTAVPSLAQDYHDDNVSYEERARMARRGLVPPRGMRLGNPREIGSANPREIRPGSQYGDNFADDPSGLNGTVYQYRMKVVSVVFQDSASFFNSYSNYSREDLERLVRYSFLEQTINNTALTFVSDEEDYADNEAEIRRIKESGNYNNRVQGTPIKGNWMAPTHKVKVIASISVGRANNQWEINRPFGLKLDIGHESERQVITVTMSALVSAFNTNTYSYAVKPITVVRTRVLHEATGGSIGGSAPVGRVYDATPNELQPIRSAFGEIARRMVPFLRGAPRVVVPISAADEKVAASKRKSHPDVHNDELDPETELPSEEEQEEGPAVQRRVFILSGLVKVKSITPNGQYFVACGEHLKKYPVGTPVRVLVTHEVNRNSEEYRPMCIQGRVTRNLGGGEAEIRLYGNVLDHQVHNLSQTRVLPLHPKRSARK